MPSFWVVSIQQAWNHTVSGVRLRSKMVPAVTEVLAPHSEHMNRPSPSFQPPSTLSQVWQTKPLGHRNHDR
jgi:hypothetical protein